MERGGKIELSAPIPSIHLFDPNTGESLRKQEFNEDQFDEFAVSS